MCGCHRVSPALRPISAKASEQGSIISSLGIVILPLRGGVLSVPCGPPSLSRTVVQYRIRTPDAPSPSGGCRGQRRAAFHGDRVPGTIGFARRIMHCYTIGEIRRFRLLQVSARTIAFRDTRAPNWTTAGDRRLTSGPSPNSVGAPLPDRQIAVDFNIDGCSSVRRNAKSTFIFLGTAPSTNST